MNSTNQPFPNLALLALAARTDDVWSDFKPFPRASWREAVANGDTQLGYWDWVDLQIDIQY